MVKLPTETQAKLDLFVIKAVTENLMFHVNGTGTVTQKLSIQQLINETSDATLHRYFDFLDKVPVTTGSKLRGTNQKFYISDISAADLRDIIDIIIYRREEIAKQHSLSRKKLDLENKLAALETPAETKAKLQKELDALNGV